MLMTPQSISWCSLEQINDEHGHREMGYLFTAFRGHKSGREEYDWNGRGYVDVA